MAQSALSINGLRGAQDGVQIGLAALTVQQLVQQGGQPVQADAAGHTFAAALGQAEFQKALVSSTGAVSAGGRRDAALHVGVEIVHCALGILPWGDTQSAQNQWSPFPLGGIARLIGNRLFLSQKSKISGKTR